MAGELAPDRGPRTVGISIEHFDKDLTITRYERLPLIANRFFQASYYKFCTQKGFKLAYDAYFIFIIVA